MKKLIRVLSILLAIIVLFSGCVGSNVIDPTTTKPTTEITTEVTTEEVIISDELQEIADDTIEQVENGETLDTEEKITSNSKEEATIENELEEDGTVEIEDISYDGTNTGKGLELLGKYQGLTYYSQADSRWGSVLYTSNGNKSQTIKSSGCGPTSAAMVISSSKGTILPTATAKLSVDNGYRTKNNGTAWSYWSFIADYFDFKDYDTTYSFATMVKYLSQDKNKDGIADYFVVASCGPGLFTTGGHYIVLMGDKNNTITVYDPYYYYGKFNTTSRKKANVKVNGNIAYITETNAQKYGNFKCFWIYSNDASAAIKKETTTKKKVSTTSKQKITTVTKYVKVNSVLNVRKGPGSNYTKVDSIKNGTKVRVYETKKGWSRIGTNRWVKSDYLVNKSTTYKTAINKTYKLKSTTTLYSKGDLTGTQYKYKSNTTVKVLKHYSRIVDYIYIPTTGRYAYVLVSQLK